MLLTMISLSDSSWLKDQTEIGEIPITNFGILPYVNPYSVLITKEMGITNKDTFLRTGKEGVVVVVEKLGGTDVVGILIVGKNVKNGTVILITVVHTAVQSLTMRLNALSKNLIQVEA